MKTGRYTRFIVSMLMLLMYGAGDVCAQLAASNITIKVKQANTAGTEATSSVTATEGSVSAAVSGRLVTLTVTPKSGYYINATDIVIDPMIDTNKANAPTNRRVPITTEMIVGTLYNDATGREPENEINSIVGPSSAYYVFTLPTEYDGAYVTATFTVTTLGETITITSSTSVGESPSMSGHYVLIDDVPASWLSNLGTGTFTGILEGKAKSDGTFPKITGLENALFSTIDGSGTVKNIVLDNVSISGYTTISNKKATGAIANVAKGSARIYNCGILATNSTVTTDEDGYTEITDYSSTVGESNSDYVGGLVGYLDGSARVINCYSYAKITAGNTVGGIVGRNNVSTRSNNLNTMVMNCMFYGDIDTDNTTNRAPIYNGVLITNRGDADGGGVSNFNYYWGGAPYVQNQKINTYNCALAAETRYLQRFEFFRNMLNSNRALAAWWATNAYDNKKEMLKWVMEPSQIGSKIPYPILKAPFDNQNKAIKYPSVVNIDADNAESISNNADIAKTQYNQGRKLGTLSISIRMGSGDGSAAPAGAVIIKSSVAPNITDKDPKHFNFNYYKVQLPYYNDVGTGNYTHNKVVTGWKIVSMSKSAGSFTTGSDASANVDANGDITLTTPYNFADRNSTVKDIYSSNNIRVFSQGAYFDVPEGVTSITIEPYWAQCVYVADAYPDVAYDQNMTTAYNVNTVGTINEEARYTNGQSYSINGENQVVYTSMSNAAGQMPTSGTVYDNAIVLVGNVHSLALSSDNKNKPYTIMSIDLDKDNEPDYSYILRFDDRKKVHPVRIDFLNVIGLGMAQKSTGGKGTYTLGIMQTYGWFEVTNTGLFRVTQFEYDAKDTKTNGSHRENSPMILQGGVIEQWVTVGGNETRYQESKSVTYYHVGGNVWFKEFHIGVHQDKNLDSNPNQFVSPHPPVSVTGGDFEVFYLTGMYNTPNANYDDNAECYINGGRFNKVAGTGMQGIGGFTMSGTTKTSYTNGNIIWQIDNADINEFYAGGINAAHIAEGNIFTLISNSRVDQFCGGPKFGNMNSDKRVVTNANNCTFRTFFGAGYGGNSYNREYPTNKYNTYNYDWNSWLAEVYSNVYNPTYKGVATRIDYQFIPRSTNIQNVARLFVDYVSFSLATTHDVTSKLNGCTITKSPLGNLNLFEGCIGNFYGGGNLGKVEGPVKSTLTNCTIEGNAFGAGYSATTPTVSVMATSFQKEPKYDESSGSYLEAVLPTTETYEWEYKDEVNSTATAINTGTTKLFTTESLDKSNLGSVSGAVTLTITTSGSKRTIIGTEGDNNTGNVYGGGDASYVNNETTPANASTTVNISGNTTINGDVFGGGNEGLVSGSTKVNVMYTE